MKPRFGRVITAMITPFNEDGSLDVKGACDLAQWLAHQGNDALVLAGTTGESPTITQDEQIKLVKAVVEAVEIPVIAGVFLLKSYKNALFINKYVPGANIPENILNRLKNAKDPLQEGIQIAAEQAHDFMNIANGIHLMAVKSEHLIPEIIEKANLSLEY